MAIIDMKTMRYINLLDKVSRVKTRRCFVHNNTIFFAVPGSQISKAIGPSAQNVRKMQESTGLKIKIIKDADGVEDAKRFVEDIVSPVKVKSIEVRENALVITGGSNQNKATLIGRNKRRYEELKKVINDFFRLDLKII